MPLNMVSMAIYVTLEGKIPRTPLTIKRGHIAQAKVIFQVLVVHSLNWLIMLNISK